MDSQKTDVVLTEEVGDKGVLILNRPKALNALNLEMILKLKSTFEKWADTKSMIIIKSNLENVFSAGGDVASISKADTIDHGKDIFRNGYTMDFITATLKIPYIALINGITYGGSVGLTIHAKYIVATEKTVFSMPETAIGYYTDSSACYFFPRLQGKLGFYLGLTGLRLKGADALHAGVATHFCDSAKIPELEKALLNIKNTNQIENVLNDFCFKPKTQFSLTKYLPQINKHFSASSVEGILYSLEQDDSEWAKHTIKTLRKMSPTSLKVTFRVLSLGANLSLGECLQMDYRVAVNVIQTHDFHEGINALLIKKHNKPKWNPARIEDVTEQQVLALFRPLGNNEDLPIYVKLKSQL